MNIFARTIALLLFVFLALPISAKEIPVTRKTINTQADAVIVGEVRKIESVRSRVLIEVAVVEKIFDRRNSVASIAILNLHQQGTSAYLQNGESYIFVTGVCENGANVLLGRQFFASVKDGYADTLGWSGFSEKTELATLRSELAGREEKDPFLGNEICRILFECEQEREAESMEIP